MKIVEQFKSLLPALALMAICSAAILYLPEWSRDTGTLPNASSSTPKAPVTIQQDRDKQA